MPSKARLENFSIWTMNKQHIKEIIWRVKWGQKIIMEKLNRAQKCSILGPQNLGSRTWAPGPPRIRTWQYPFLYAPLGCTVHHLASTTHPRRVYRNGTVVLFAHFRRWLIETTRVLPRSDLSTRDKHSRLSCLGRQWILLEQNKDNIWQYM